MPLNITAHLLHLVKQEKRMLRDELKGLKNCQIQFLTGAVVSAGVLLGLPGVFKPLSGQDVVKCVYLVPLVILIPCWWGFFDKAKTITRIVGYFRVLEEIAIIEAPATLAAIERFVGWENSVSDYRRWERNGEFKRIEYQAHRMRWREYVKAFFLIPSQRYWPLAHYSFTILSVSCLAITAYELWREPGHHPSEIILAIASAAFLYSFAWNTAILSALMWGRHSYAATFAYWHRILASQPQ